MATSQVSICNLALSWLGTPPIMSIDDETVEAALCKAQYDDALKATLEERDWTFATDRLILTPVVEPPLWGFGNKFLVPAQVRRVISVTVPRGTTIDVSSDVLGFNVQWQLESGFILADEDLIHVRAVLNNDNAGAYPGVFVQALAARLAADMSIGLTHSLDLYKTLWAFYDLKITTASGTDGRQGRRETVEAPRLTRARRLGYPAG